MVNRRLMSSMAAAFSLFLASPALSSAHTLAVSASPSQCATPLNGEYTATVTVTDTYFGGTTENIPAGQNVHELPSSTDRGNTGLNQNYFTQGVVGTQTGSANLGQPTSFTSPSNGSAATQHLTVTTSVPETYVLGNSYMRSPSSATITAPVSGCAPPPPPGCAGGQTLISGKCVPPGSCPADETLSGNVCIPLTSCLASQTLVSGKCVPPSTCPSGETLSQGVCIPPTACPSGQTLTGGECVPPTACPAGETLRGSVCAKPAATAPAVCRASTRGYKVRVRQKNTITVSVQRGGVAVAGTKVRVSLPGGKVVTRTTDKTGNATFTVEPARSGTLFVRSSSCQEMVRVKVYAAKTPATHPVPSFTG
jgi:hypothetical protein